MQISEAVGEVEGPNRTLSVPGMGVRRGLYSIMGLGINFEVQHGLGC